MATTNNAALAKVQEYLENRAKTEAEFAAIYAKPNKSLEECWKYIVSEAKKQAVEQCACIADEDVFNWAVHYYTEDEVKAPENTPTAKVTTTPTPKIENKIVALKPTETPKPQKANKSDKPIQLSLFDF